jgi:hypothetical protein
MDPVFTLQWPEFVLAHHLQKQLPKKEGYSVLVPLSRQEKGIDLAILKKLRGAHKALTIQIKASRTYYHPPSKRETTKRFQFNTWFRRFEVPEDADFILLVGMYAPNTGRTKHVAAEWYKECTLLFTREEMKTFMASRLTKGGQPDQMFGFGFDEPTKVYLNRGDQGRASQDYSSHLLDARMDLLRKSLSA